MKAGPFKQTAWQRAARRDYCERNRQAVRRHNRNYYRANRARRLRALSEYREQNRERARRVMRAFRARNPGYQRVRRLRLKITAAWRIWTATLAANRTRREGRE